MRSVTSAQVNGSPWLPHFSNYGLIPLGIRYLWTLHLKVWSALCGHINYRLFLIYFSHVDSLHLTAILSWLGLSPPRWFKSFGYFVCISIRHMQTLKQEFFDNYANLLFSFSAIFGKKLLCLRRFIDKAKDLIKTKNLLQIRTKKIDKKYIKDYRSIVY